jgi:hypothetical protein
LMWWTVPAPPAASSDRVIVVTNHIRELSTCNRVARVGLIAELARVVLGRENERHAVVNFRHHRVGVGSDHRERAYPLAGCRDFPVFP